MWDLKNNINYSQNRNGLTGIESKLTVTKGGKEDGQGYIRSWV